MVPRPVVRESIARSSPARSVVGGTVSWANPEKTTSPMRMFGSWARTNVRTAAWAAVNRLGSTSVAHIDPLTSTARITADPDTGTSTLACGRAAARPRQARAPSRNATGR